MKPPNASQSVDIPIDSPQAARHLEDLQVLLAEDCVDQARLYLRFLDSMGVKITLECNGQSAVDAVRKSPSLFDAVGMDVQRPEMDGVASTGLLRELGYNGAIIALAAYDSEELKRSWFQAGCDEFLEKPASKQNLIDAVLRHTMAKTEAVS